MRADEIGSTHLPLRYCDATGIQGDLLSDECLEVGDCAKQHLEIQRARVGIDTLLMIFILLSFNCAGHRAATFKLSLPASSNSAANRFRLPTPFRPLSRSGAMAPLAQLHERNPMPQSTSPAYERKDPRRLTKPETSRLGNLSNRSAFRFLETRYA
jgi:hypothetical protein